MRLSFDDGPGPSTSDLLDVLESADVRATFFVLGMKLGPAREVAIRALRQGHVLGNHTWSHARPGAITDAALIAEIDATDALIREIHAKAGTPPPAVIPLRLPYGILPDDPRPAVLARVGRQHVGWTCMLDDWQRPQPAPERLLAQMRWHIDAQAARGEDAVFCLHDSSRHGEARPATVEAVRLLLAARGQPVQPRDSN